MFFYIVISKQKQENKVFPPLASPPIRLKKFCPELRKNGLLINQSYESNFALYSIIVIEATPDNDAVDIVVNTAVDEPTEATSHEDVEATKDAPSPKGL